MKFSVFFLAILLFASCKKMNKDYESGIERWKAHNIHNYNYRIGTGGFFNSGEYLVSVAMTK